MKTNIPPSMPNPSQIHQTSPLEQLTTLELAQALMERLTISPEKWHQLKSNRQARAMEQIAAALVFLLKKQPAEALPRLEQATGWLDRSISAPPCPTHGEQATRTSKMDLTD